MRFNVRETDCQPRAVLSPHAGAPIFHTLGYVMHDGGHGTIPSDWDLFLQFVRMHL